MTKLQSMMRQFRVLLSESYLYRQVAGVRARVPMILQAARQNDQVRMTGRMCRFLVRVSKTTLFTYCVGNTFITVVGYPACVNGKSMQPVFNFNTSEARSDNMFNFSSWRGSYFRLDLDWVFVNCWAARQYSFTRGDIVVFVSPKDPFDFVIKRLIALEGDSLSSYRFEKTDVMIPDGHCWVEGDNWDNSVDSNRYGPIPLGLIFGVATHVIWPPNKWQRIQTSIPPYLLPERVQVNSRSSNNGDDSNSWYKSWLTNLKIMFYFIKN